MTIVCTSAFDSITNTSDISDIVCGENKRRIVMIEC